MVKALPMVVLGIIMVGGSVAPGKQSHPCSSKFNAEAPGAGVEWLKWDQKTREMFVFGYIVGHDRGSQQGCIIASDLAPSAWIMPGCLERTRTFSQTLDSYVDKTTQYYQKYPEDQAIQAVYILPFLSDQDAKPLEEIHRMANNCALFMTP